VTTVLAAEAAVADEVVTVTTGRCAWLIPVVPIAGFVLVLRHHARLGDRTDLIAIGASAAPRSSSPSPCRRQVIAEPATLPAADAGVDRRRRTQVTFDAAGRSADRRDAAGGHRRRPAHPRLLGRLHARRRALRRFFAYLNLFLASMLILVLGANLLTLFLGWELVGLSSYLLIGFWFERADYAAAAKKAFITNRVGDVSFMVAMFVAFATFGTLDILGIIDAAAELDATATRDRSRCCCSAARSPSRRRSRCTCGCPTRWPAPPPCRR
jgi:NADH-quinone oxidoreductase subunit L